MAGFIATVVSNPVDMAKTRIMNQKEKLYGGVFDCLVKVKNIIMDITLEIQWQSCSSG
jgi:hypothetical protein